MGLMCSDYSVPGWQVRRKRTVVGCFFFLIGTTQANSTGRDTSRSSFLTEQAQ